MPTDKYLNKIVLNKMTREQFEQIDKNPDEFYAVTDNTILGGISMFDTILKDHVLTYEESKGLALQGTYVYKDAIAGSHYGYPDFYAKCLEEYNEATTTETVNGVTVKVHSNGHKFYDIANKDAIDSFFNATGFAWFYGIDTENERVFLPRNNWFEQITGDVLQVGNGVEAGLPNIEGDYYPKGPAGGLYSGVETTSNGAFKHLSYSSGHIARSSDNNYEQYYLNFDASRSNPIYGNSNTVQPNAVKKLLYICVGNTTNYEGITDVVNQGMEILEQVAQKVNVDGTNLNTEGKSLISGLAFPSSRYVDLTLGASGTTYTAPANGYYLLSKFATAQAQNIAVGKLGEIWVLEWAPVAQVNLFCWVPVTKGETISITYSATGTTNYFKFYYAEGEV